MPDDSAASRTDPDRALSSADTRRLRRRLLVTAASYLLAVLVSALVARAGLAAGRSGADRIGLPWAVVGLAGMLGAGTLATAAWYARRALAGPDPTRLARAVLLARISRIGMVLVAAVAAVLGVRLAPDGTERGFAILASTGLAALLALFALAANDLPRLQRQTTAPTPKTAHPRTTPDRT
ncbi:hypothetical protein [Plantactinospora endophytica]|uniref:DUF2975 domain-containing protein n=1 Tax=Plantactinospora endophytica TaxID=673535 RepID=A0ABQ4E2E4_9ACTN|nr:hypothetical protein [Plantactinospora endophytica]GIG88842.1 hypothetical protein Pen02_37780 [Plantactinospora endophytica]